MGRHRGRLYSPRATQIARACLGTSTIMIQIRVSASARTGICRTRKPLRWVNAWRVKGTASFRTTKVMFTALMTVVPLGRMLARSRPVNTATCGCSDLDADDSKVYAAISWPSEREATSLFEFDLKTGKTLRLCAMADLDPALQDLRVHTGYDAWDADGRFYFASFSGRPDQSVVLTRIDPKRLKAALRNPGGTQPLR